MHCAVAITSVGSLSAQQSPRIAILSSEGDILILDIESTGGGGGGAIFVWTIMAHIRVRKSLHGILSSTRYNERKHGLRELKRDTAHREGIIHLICPELHRMRLILVVASYCSHTL